jgi:hypothetical protein
MYAGTLYAGAPYAGSETEPTNEEISLPFIGNSATAFAPSITTTYPVFDPDDWPNEVQTITKGGVGLETFTLTFDGQTTAPIPADATPAEIYLALVALPNIDEGDISVGVTP